MNNFIDGREDMIWMCMDRQMVDAMTFSMSYGKYEDMEASMQCLDNDYTTGSMHLAIASIVSMATAAATLF